MLIWRRYRRNKVVTSGCLQKSLATETFRNFFLVFGFNMMVATRQRRSREVTGPTPHSVAIVRTHLGYMWANSVQINSFWSVSRTRTYARTYDTLAVKCDLRSIYFLIVPKYFKFCW